MRFVRSALRWSVGIPKLMNLLITTAHVRRLPLLPLSNLVFFPNTTLSLHLSDPRAIALARYCLVHAWPLGVVTVRPGEPEPFGDEGRLSPLSEMGSIAHIVSRQEQDGDGLEVSMQGIARVRVLEELPPQGRAYRMARVELVSDYLPGDRISLEAQMASVRSALLSLARMDRSVGALISAPLMRTRSAAVLADALAAMVFPDLADRQALLDCPRVHERLDRVLAQLSQLLAEAGAARARRGLGSSTPD